MAKEISMKNAQAEIKAVAKAVTASMTRQGHHVPHSVVLNALAASLNARDWHKLKARTASAAELEPVAPVVSTPQFVGPVVTAMCWTNNMSHEVDFDARGYLSQAADAHIMAIIYEGFSCADSLNDIAIFAASYDKDLEAMFQFIGNLQTAGVKDVPGIECSVTPKEIFAWMASERPALLNKYLCADEGIQLTKVNTGNAPQWYWATSQFSAEMKRGLDAHPSQASAEAEAVATLGLLAPRLSNSLQAS